MPLWAGGVRTMGERLRSKTIKPRCVIHTPSSGGFRQTRQWAGAGAGHKAARCRKKAPPDQFLDGMCNSADHGGRGPGSPVRISQA